MDQVWELIAPWVAALGGVTGCGTIIYAIVRLCITRIINKNSALIDSKFNINDFANAVAKALAGKTLNIDVTAVTEKALKKTANALDDRVEKVENNVALLVPILLAIAKAILRLKALSDDERKELSGAITALSGEKLKPRDDEVMTVLLDPVSLPEEPTDEENGDNVGVNFGGLDE